MAWINELRFVSILSAALLLAGSGDLFRLCAATEDAKQQARPGARFVLEDVRIEGKIRRPQLVLIKADQRPAFEPMSMQSFGKSFNIVQSVDQTVIEDCPYKRAFKFEGRAVANLVP